MKQEPQAEHRWLQRMMGEWDCEGEAIMGPDSPPFRYTGTETVRTIDGLWILAEAQGETPNGGVMNSLMTLGYDPRRSRFVGTFIASQMTHLWVYEGGLDAMGQTLTLDTEGPGMSGDGSLAKYRDTIRFLEDDHRTLSSEMMLGDGSWTGFMTAHYRRKK